MSSQKQIDANRRNAQMSTGPCTPEGRAAVRSNALRHGLTAKSAVLENESSQDFQALLDDFRAEHQPASPTENLLVEQLAMAAWRLERLRGIETGLFDLRMSDLSREVEKRYNPVREHERHAFVFLDDTRNAHAIENLFRYESRIERSFYRALHELQRLRATSPPGIPPAPLAASHDDPLPPAPEPSAPANDSAEQSQSQERTLHELDRPPHPLISSYPVTACSDSYAEACPTGPPAQLTE